MNIKVAAYDKAYLHYNTIGAKKIILFGYFLKWCSKQCFKFFKASIVF